MMYGIAKVIPELTEKPWRVKTLRHAERVTVRGRVMRITLRKDMVSLIDEECDGVWMEQDLIEKKIKKMSYERRATYRPYRYLRCAVTGAIWMPKEMMIRILEENLFTIN